MTIHKNINSFLSLEEYFNTHSFYCGMKSGNSMNITPSGISRYSFLKQIVARRALKKLPKTYRNHLILAFSDSLNKVNPSFRVKFQIKFMNRNVNLSALGMQLASKTQNDYIDSHHIQASYTKKEISELLTQTRDYFFMLLRIFDQQYQVENDLLFNERTK